MKNKFETSQPLAEVYVLLEKYPDIGVIREDLGDMRIDVDSWGDRGSYIFLYLSRENKEQMFPDVGMTLKDRISDQYTYLRVRPSEEGKEIIVSQLQDGVNPEEVIEKAKQGLEIFDALMKVHPGERSFVQNRACDWMREDPERDLLATGIPYVQMSVIKDMVDRMNLLSMGLTDPTPHFTKKFAYFQEVLNR